MRWPRDILWTMRRRLYQKGAGPATLLDAFQHNASSPFHRRVDDALLVSRVGAGITTVAGLRYVLQLDALSLPSFHFPLFFSFFPGAGL